MLNFSKNPKVIEKPNLSEISKYIPSPESLRYKDGSFYCYPPLLRTEKSSNDPNAIKSIMNNQQISQCVAPAPTTTVLTPKTNNDLYHFIEKQEGYIEQLERESQFCRVFIFLVVFTQVFINTYILRMN